MTSLAISALTVDIRDVGDSISECSRHKNPANSFALVSGSRSGLHDEPHCTSFVGDRGTCKARKLFLWRREELQAKLAQVHSEERMEVMVVPPRLPGRPTAREGGEGRAGREIGVDPSFNEKISPPPLRHIANLIQYRRTP